MGKNWDWSKIKDGFSGFEDLAVDFVNDIFKNNTWEATKRTRDGNKDAYTIILGYSLDEKDSKYWWMEAKYSTERKNITRYRLDSTIVSAILEKNVSCIIFVTNINVKSKIIFDIQNALKNSTDCEYVYFFSKYNMELWLKQNPNYFKTYFPNSDYNDLIIPSIVVTEQLEIYPQCNNQMAFKEPVKIIQKEEIYYGYFSIFSSSIRQVKIRPNKNIVLCSDSLIHLTYGDNPIRIAFSLDKSYEKDMIFFIEDLCVLPNYLFSVSETTKSDIIIKSQNEIISSINSHLLDFKKNKILQINCISGASGSGKSYTINKIVTQNSFLHYDLFYVEFAKSSTDNIFQLVNLVLFILFPYLPLNQIDLPYVQSINKNGYISPLTLELIKYKDNFEKLYNVIREMDEDEELFPGNLLINNRFIVLDDIQKLDFFCFDFLTKIIINLKSKKAEVFLILGGQPLFLKNESYKRLKENCVINEYRCAISATDLYYFLNNKKNFTVTLSNHMCENLFPSVIEFALFIQYIGKENIPITNVDELILECKLFHNSGLLEQYVIDEFIQIFTYNNILRDLCDNIYWSVNGFSIEYDNIRKIEGFSALLSANLIKFNTQGILVPYHDIYKEYYRAHFMRPSFSKTSEQKEGNLTYLHESILSSNNQILLNDIVNQIKILEQKRNYYSIMYILQDIFENEESELLKNRLGYIIYIKLYYYYLIACLHVSLNHTDLELFKELQKNTEDTLDSELILIYDCATWELINLYYAWLDYDNSQKNISLLYKIIKQEIEQRIISSSIENCLRFHDIKVMETLLASDQNSPYAQTMFESNSKRMLELNFHDRLYSFGIRYALTISCRNLKYSLYLIKECSEKIIANGEKGSRYYLWGQFYINYFNMIYYNDISLLKNALFYCRQLKKNYFMDYRKMILGLASFYFSKNNISEGNRYLLSDIYVRREYRPRQKAFYFETVALSEALIGNYDKAANYLKKSAVLFCQLPYFLNVVEHNLGVLKKKKFHQNNINYYFGETFDENIYYIDPRCAT